MTRPPVALLVSMLLSACPQKPAAPTPPSSPLPPKVEAVREQQSPEACTSNDECVLSTFGGCCTRCAKHPHARSQAALARDLHRCALVKCDFGTAPCTPIEPVENFKAVCRDRFCAIEGLERCDLSKKPSSPSVDATTRAKCKAAGGTWEGKSDTLSVDSMPGAAGANSSCKTVGRGKVECVGCTQLPTTDKGKACRYDWDCEGSCREGACSGQQARSDSGCEPRCVQGVVKVLCED